MSHLTDEQLSAHVDGALAPPARTAADAHLATCAECRGRREAVAVLDRELAGALAHDPGEAYFDSFAGRVAARIAAPAAPARAAARRGWLTPARLATVGGALAIAVVVALSWRQWNDRGGAPLVAARGTTAAPVPRAPVPPAAGRLPPAPPAGRGTRRAAPGADVAPGTPGPSAPQEGAAPPSRLQQVRTLPSGEQVVVGSKQAATWREPAPSGTTAPSLSELKRRLISPLGAQAPAPATKPEARLEAPEDQAARAPAAPLARSLDTFAAPAAPATTARLCGVVRDPQGRAVPGAQVAIVETGRTVATDSTGAFCLEAPAARATLTAMAVGFAPARLAVDARAGAAAVSVTLAPVSPLGGRSPGFVPGGGRTLATPGGAGDPYARESLTLRAAARVAADGERIAARERSATRWDEVAARWDAVASGVSHDEAARDARARGASARHAAWTLEPDDARGAALVRAVDAWVATLPAQAPERVQAARWRAEVAGR